MKKSRQTKRFSKRATKDLEVPVAGRKNTKDVKGGATEMTVTKLTNTASPKL
jgi:hypothetical protein